MNTLYKFAISIALGTATLCSPLSQDALASGEVVGPSAVGADVADNPNGLGVVVSRVDPGGPFAQAGISPGNIILSINSQPVGDSASFYALLGTPQPGTVLFVRVQEPRTGRLRTLRVTTW